MANGNVISGSSGGSYRWYSTLTATKTAETATSVTYSVSLGYYTRWAISSYANGAMSGAVSGSWNGTMTGTNSGTSKTVVTKSVVFTKGSSAQTKTVSGYIQVTGGFGNGTSNVSLNISVPAITYSAPTAPSGCGASRVSDTQAKVTWTNGATSTTQPRSAVYVERSTDGGAWTQIASVGASTANYTDNSISANHSYQYRVRSYGSGGYSGYSTSGTIYTTPAAPASVSTERTGDGTALRVSADITSVRNATSYEVQYKVGEGDWTASGTTTTFPVAVNPSTGGETWVRVRSVRDSLASDWATSASVTTVVPPLAPSVSLNPAGVSPTGQAITVSWVLNHPDGSAQTAAQVEYRLGDMDTQTVSLTTQQSYVIDPGDFTGTVQVRVRTKGADEDWGEWSGYAYVNIAYPPSVTINSPGIDGGHIATVPYTFEWEVSDSTGVSAQAFTIANSTGTLYTRQLDGSVEELTVGLSEVPFQNLADYTLTITAMGGSGLSTTETREFGVRYVSPSMPDAEIAVDHGDLSVAVTVVAGPDHSDSGETIQVEGEPGAPMPGFSVFGSTADGESVDELSLVVSGRNLWVNPSGTSSGMTVTSNEDGSITLSGAATSNDSIAGDYLYTLKPETTYTLSIDKTDPNWVYGFFVQSYNGSAWSTLTLEMVSVDHRTFIVPAESKQCRCGFQPGNGVALSGTYHVMLNEGTEALPWEKSEITTIPIDLDGNVLASTSDDRDVLTIGADGSTSILKTDGSTVDLPDVEMPDYPFETTQVMTVSNVPSEVRVDYLPADSYAVTREYDGESWLVAEGLQSGEEALDPLPPLNVPVRYVVRAIMASGAAAERNVDFTVETDSCALNFGRAAATGMAARLDPSWSRSVARSSTLYHFADGGESGGLPIAYGGPDLDATMKAGFTLLGAESLRELMALASAYPTVWFRDYYGGRYLCTATWDFSSSVPASKLTVSASLTETVFEEAW